MTMPPRNWLGGGLRVEDPAAVEGAKEAGDARFAGDGVDPYLAEHRAMAVHRPVLELHAASGLRLDA